MTTPNTPDYSTPPRGGMPKWLIIVLVVLLFVVLGCCGMFSMCFWVGRRVAAPAIQQAAQRQMERQGVVVDNNGAGLSVPAEFPKDIPIAPGFKVNMKIMPPGTKSGSLTLTGNTSMPDLQNYYEKEMANQGWKQTTASAQGDVFQQVYSKEKRTATVVGSRSE